MNKPKLDRQMLHEFLWEHKDRNGYLHGNACDLAKKFGVTKSTFSVILKEMEEQGRLVRQRRKFLIIDPQVHRWEYTPDVKL